MVIIIVITITYFRVLGGLVKKREGLDKNNSCSLSGSEEHKRRTNTMLSSTTIRLERVTDWFTAINYEALYDVTTILHESS